MSKTVDKTVKNILKLNSIASRQLGIADYQDPLEGIDVVDKFYGAAAARQVRRALDYVQRILDSPAKDALKNGYKITTNKDDIGLSELIKKRIDHFKFNSKVEDFLIFSNLYSRGCVFYPVLSEDTMAVADRGHLKSRLSLSALRKIEKINVIHEDHFTPYVQFTDPLSNTYNELEKIQVAGNSDVHPSRIIWGVNDYDPHIHRGISILDRVVTACKGINIAQWTISQLLLKYKTVLVKYPAEETVNKSKSGGKAAVQWIVDTFKLAFTSKSVAALPSTYEFEVHETTFTGIREAVQFLKEYLAGVSRTPQSIIFGAASGELASADADKDDYRDMVKSEIQEGKIKPLLDFFIPLILNEKEGPVYNKLKANNINPSEVTFDIVFNPIKLQDEKDIEQTKLIRANRQAIEITNTITDSEQARKESYPLADPLAVPEPSGVDNDLDRMRQELQELLNV